MGVLLTTDLITSSWRPDGVRLSPDGAYVAWSASPYGKADEHGESAIWVASVGAAESARRWTYGGADAHPQWSPDGSQIALLSDRMERGVSSLFVLDVAGGEAAPMAIRKRSITAFCWSPDGTRIAFVAPDEPNAEDKRRKEQRDDPAVYGEGWHFNRLHVVDCASGKASAAFETDLHVQDVAWSPDGTALAFSAQDSPNPDESERRSLWVMTVTDGEARRIFRGSQLEGLTWTADGSRLLFVAPHGHVPQGSYTVWSLELAEGSEPQCIGPGPDEFACAIRVRAADDGRAVLLVAEGLASRLDWADSATGERSPLWDAPGDVFAFDVARGTVAAFMSTPERPPEIWAGPPQNVRLVSDHHAAWAEVVRGKVEDFAFTASDGLELDGILIRPPAALAPDADRPNATVVLVHGGPYWRSGRDVHCAPYDWGQWLACAGYTVLMPNYRGGLGHGNAFATSVRGDMGGAEWGDVLAAVDAAVERGIAEPDRLGIGGWSQGGFLTAWAVTQTDRFKAAVMGAGVSDWGAMAAISDLPTFEGALGGSTPWDGPGPHRAAERSPISYASQWRTPLLILHGERDIRVPIGQATAFHRALLSLHGQSEDVPVDLVTYPREPHGIMEQKHQVDLLRRVREFYARWLPL